MSERPEYKSPKGPIAWMAQNSVAANLLLFVALFGGLISLMRIKQEIFPEFDLDMVNISVAYPGASPADVEQGITLAVEESVRGVEGVKRVTSQSSEGMGVISAELLLGADGDKVLADIKSEIDRIRTFPEESEEPVIALASRKREVITLIVAGDQPLPKLHAFAERARARLLESPDITQVEVEGLPPLEISVEIPRQSLENYGLTLDDVARQISQASLELPGGAIETKSGQILVRVSDRALYGDQFKDIVLRGTAQGAKLRLGDIATIKDGYEDTKQASFYNGLPAVSLTAFRVGDETPTEVATAVKEAAVDLQAEFPGNITVEIWDDDSKLLEERMNLLMKNAVMGLALVLVVLAMFLKLRLAFWVALGIPASFMGAFFLLGTGGMSINMVSLFALIICLGLVVDDAIVVSENTYAKIREGTPILEASIESARQMALPVTFSVLTTMIAFSPLFFLPGVVGKIFFVIPLVVIAVLFFSLVEVFFVLPAHLGHGGLRPPGKIMQWIEARRARIADGLEIFIEKAYEPVLKLVLRNKALFLSIAVAHLVIFGAVLKSGLLPFTFFPELEGDQVTAAARLPYGAPIEKNRQVREAMEQAAFKTMEDMGGRQYFLGMFTQQGVGPRSRSRATETGSHLVTIELQMVSSEKRPFTGQEFSGAWAKNMPVITGIESLTFNSAVGPGAGSAVDVQLSHYDTRILAKASATLTEQLRNYSELLNIENSYAAGKPQFDFKLLPLARSLGLTSAEVARQIRASFYGTEAIREQRGRNELKVMVRLPEEQRASRFDLEQLRIRTPDGGMVPLSYVAGFEKGRAPTDISREDGQRIVNVSAKLGPDVSSPRPILESLQQNELPALKEQYPGLQISLVGQQRSQDETFESMGQNFMLALFIMFAMLAIPLRSYIQPVIIMTAIPFGLIGALAGHLIMGYGLSVISIMGIIALSGVVVNSSLVLIDTSNQYRKDGLSPYDAIVKAGVRRFRPIVLTALTTFFGLTPMILEPSVQARFLIPMAISLGFGVLLSTPVALLIAPVLYLIVEDFHAWFLKKKYEHYGVEMEQTVKPMQDKTP